MRLTRDQQKVVTNSLAWCSNSFIPSDEDIEQFFAWNEKGAILRTPGSVELYRGWCCHYGDEFAWINSYERGKANPPSSPPACWIYESGGFGKPSDYEIAPFWIGWLPILVECLKTWPRSKAMFERAYTIHSYLKRSLTVDELRACLKQQKS